MKNTQHNTCSVETCDKPIRVKKHLLCVTHYHRFHRYGDPLATRYNRGEGSTFEERFWSRVALTADDSRCWEWQGYRNVARGGYGSVYFNGKDRPAHAVAYALVHGHLPADQGLHSCDNPPCVNPKHIRNGTDKDNSADKVARNRQAKGQMLPQTKLNPDKVREIRSRRAAGETCDALAKEFGVWPGIISAVALRQTWRHVE